LADGARFCAGCGTAVASIEGEQSAQQAAPQTLVETPLDETEVAPAFEEDARKGPNWLLIVGGAAIFLLLLLYYLVFIRDDLPSNPATQAPVAKQEAKTEEVEAKQYFAIADANIRDRPTAQGANILGQLLRGTAASGTLVNGEDGTSQWLELEDGKGFVGLVNLSETKPTILTKLLGDKKWTADKPLEILSQPDSSGAVVDRIAVGTVLTLYGLTSNDYIEIKLRKGGVGYIADGARILAAAPVLGKPITISFNPSTCNFGGDVNGLFAKLSAQLEAKRLAVERGKYPSEEAREAAISKYAEASESRSEFMKVERSFNGLSITAIGQHYESQSVYFADPPEKVAAVFRTAGNKIGKDGNFRSTDLLSSITASGSDGRSYGKSELSCGV
jgi:hypothetical protein